MENFVVITVVSNPVRYKSRYDLYFKFADMLKCSGATLITVEQAFGDRPFVITERDNPNHLQFRSIDELWIKESMINAGINYVMQVLPDVKYIAWVDADVFPMRPAKDWFQETYHQLQHYEIVQMFEYAQDLSPNYNMIGRKSIGFMKAYFQSGFQQPTRAGLWEVDDYTYHGHPGYAWAANVSALNKLGTISGPLIDWAILGAGDRHMALGLIGAIEQSIQEGLHPNYGGTLREWQKRAETHLKRDVGYVPGTIYHYWHGKKQDRGYKDRWRILVDNQFDPLSDIKKDVQGLWILESESPRQARLRDEIRAYFRSRDEDYYTNNEAALK